MSLTNEKDTLMERRTVLKGATALGLIASGASTANAATAALAAGGASASNALPDAIAAALAKFRA